MTEPTITHRTVQQKARSLLAAATTALALAGVAALTITPTGAKAEAAAPEASRPELPTAAAPFEDHTTEPHDADVDTTQATPVTGAGLDGAVTDLEEPRTPVTTLSTIVEPHPIVDTLPQGQLTIDPEVVTWTVGRAPMSREIPFTVTNVGGAPVISVAPYPSSFQDINDATLTFLPNDTCIMPGRPMDFPPGASCTGTLRIEGTFATSDSIRIPVGGADLGASVTLDVNIDVEG